MAHFNSFLNNLLFSKFINKYQEEILRCSPPSLNVFDFFSEIPHFYSLLKIGNEFFLSDLRNWCMNMAPGLNIGFLPFLLIFVETII